jgi:uncharacterized protein YihD (DUF1040 family)
MRDLKRIPEILDGIKKIWEEHPDLRLGQLISNMSDRSPWPLFYIEDDELIERMEEFYQGTRYIAR